MLLYRIEVDTDKGFLTLIVAAETDEQAFSSVEEHVERHFLSVPQLKEISIVEKKRLNPGSGYLIETKNS
ncbi:DUF3906 domain-containing protein [Paenibacillus sediminis]|uniref:Phage terminase large subunit GpA-like protein n=1 Tax=Paenibacillus sediminis TaxID=664909 RepID=A0ABS4H5U6_9BACL|nr:DUF3906 family protein [Paenibacillus sediminis]MBP1937752.1 phage terminase large subunit GpA-like protein [Paenibacillus sediminis]